MTRLVPNPVYEVTPGDSACKHPFVDKLHMLDAQATVQWKCRMCGRTVGQRLKDFQRHTMPEVTK